MSDWINNILHKRQLILAECAQEDNWVVSDPIVHFVAPFLYYNERKRRPLKNHIKIAEDLFWKNIARFTFMRYWVGKIIRVFLDAEIPIVIVKGVPLVESLYYSPGFRAMNDIDLLVQHQDFRRACDLLKEIGWKYQHREDNAHLMGFIGNPKVEKKWQTGERVFLNPKGCIVDLHWHLVPYVWLRHLYQADMRKIWDKAVPLTDSNLKGAFSLSSVHNLAYLCLHIAQHGLQPLRALLDIDQFVRKCNSFPDWCWERFIACVRQWRMRSAAFHALYFSRSLFGTPVPKHIMDRLHPGLAARSRVSALIRPRDLLVHPPSAVGVRFPSLVKAALADRIADILKLLVRIAVPDANWRKQRYAADVPLSHHWRHVWDVATRGD